MIAKKSDLILESFAILNSHIKFNIPPKDKKINAIEILNSYPVDIDFNIDYNSTDNIYRIIVSIKINVDPEAKKPGYSIAITGVGFFQFDNQSKITEEQKSLMLQTSALSICITNLRSYIVNQTSYYPWGSFSFHTIDIQDLLMTKAKNEKKNR
jgi:preprotein translocase subunit SecB